MSGAKKDAMTPLYLEVFPVPTGRYCWRLRTVRGNHAAVVESAAAYMTSAAARQGWRRFKAGYVNASALVFESFAAAQADSNRRAGEGRGVP